MTGSDDDEPVDFVVGAAPDAGSAGDAAPAVDPGTEDLLEPASRDPHRTRVTILAAAVILALVLIGVAVHGRSAHRPSAAPSSSSSAPSSAPRSFGPSRPVVVGQSPLVFEALPPLTKPPACPEADDGQAACDAALSVPAAFTRAVQVYFPKLHQRTARTLKLRPGVPLATRGIWSRSWTGTGHGVSMTIYVRRGTQQHPTPLASLDDGSRSVVYSEMVTGAYIVQVQVSTVSGGRIDEQAVQDLAGDARLVALQ